MNLPVVESAQAGRDLAEHFAHIALDHVDAALRFLESYEAATKTIAAFPELGAGRTISNRKLGNIRLWPLEKFPKYTMVYQVREKSILIVRVIHAAQDYMRI